MKLAKGYISLKVAAISMKPKKWDKESNALKIEKLFQGAAEQGVKVAVITEGALEGYVIMDVINQPELANRLVEVAEPIDGIYIRRFRKLAKNLDLCLCLGFAERINKEIYNSAIFIDNDGEICGKHHKMQFDEGYHPSWFFNRLGKEIRAFNTPYGRAGFLICNDRWNALIARTLVLDGAQVIYISSYGDKSKEQNCAVLARARENGVPVVEANVGVNLIISKGEIVAYKRGNDRITTATIDIPIRPSKKIARKMEREFLEQREPEMTKRYLKTMEDLKKKRNCEIYKDHIKM
jgi:predicted amidohydrolase